MAYVKAWCGEEDGDVLEIVESLERGERSAWIRDAIREKAGRVRGEATPPPAASVDFGPVVSALHRISEQLSGITIAQAPAEPIEEDPDAAARLGSMF
jgi:hypothetical protein